MAFSVPRDPQQDMSHREIQQVFETLKLSTAPKPMPPPAQPPAVPIVFFTVSGSSPPLNLR